MAKWSSSGELQVQVQVQVFLTQPPAPHCNGAEEMAEHWSSSAHTRPGSAGDMAPP